MIKSRNVLLIALASLVAVLFVSFAFVGSVSYEPSKADEPTPDFTLGASAMSLGYSNSNFTTFNNGYSFVFFGTFSSASNSSLSITTPSLNFDSNLMSMRVNFSNSNVNNHLTILNFSVFGQTSDGVLEKVYFNNGVNAFSLNSYFVDKFITLSKSYEFIEIYLDVAVVSDYVEFSFNDFSIDFFSDYKLAYEDGYKNGYDDAKDEYYQSRYDEGYWEGFSVGSNNEFSFLSYFGAIIETPINAALSLFDFDFLGFNMRSFVLSILTISLIIVIIKFALAR